MGLQGVGFLSDTLRDLFCFFDRIVYGLIKWILFGIFDLANLTTNSDVFAGVYQRIYVILGIFMAFKLTFSFVQYLIDPESMTGKSDKSISKLFLRVFIMLAALIFLPTILFGSNGYLGRIQSAFLPTLPKIIFGADNTNGVSLPTSSVSDGSSYGQTIEKSAEDIATYTLRGFFAPSEEIDEVCGSGTFASIKPIESIDDFANHLNDKCDQINTGFLGLFATKYYKYSYNLFISTVVGVLVVLMLLGVTLDIAKRVFKLLILEVIAPVPIMSLIDPKASKEGAFGKWVKSLTTTFIDLFLKLGLVYIIIVFIHMIVNSNSNLFNNFPETAGFRRTYLIVLLILGLIFFAREAPKFIKDALGIKDSGSGGLFKDVRSIAGAAIGTAGIVGATIGNVRAQQEGNREYHEGQHFRNAFRNIGAAVSGAVGGTATTINAATKKDASVRTIREAQQQRNARNFEFRRNGGTLFGSVGSATRQTFTGETAYDRLERDWKRREDDIKQDELVLKQRQDDLNRYKAINEQRNTVTKRSMEKAAESKFTSGTYQTANGHSVTGNYRSFESTLDAAKAGVGLYHMFRDNTTGNLISETEFNSLAIADQANYTKTADTFFKFNGQDIDLNDGQDMLKGLLEENAKDYYVQAIDPNNNNVTDGTINTARDIFRQRTGREMESTLRDVKTESGILSGTIANENLDITNRSEALNNRRSALNEEKQSNEAQRAKANSGRFTARRK